MSEPIAIPACIAHAVDIWVESKGVDGAEAELQRRFRDDPDRSVPALAYLRREYGGEFDDG